MKKNIYALTIGSIVLGAGMVFATTAYANHGHTGNTNSIGMGMMGNNTLQPTQQTNNGHMSEYMGTDKTDYINVPVTTATNEYDRMHATGTTQNHMTDNTGNTTD